MRKVVILILTTVILAALLAGGCAKPAPAPASSEDPKQRLKQLKEMLDEGLVTEAEYEAKKTEILAGM